MRRSPRRWAIVVAVALGVVGAAPAVRTDARPNVVIVLVDDMGWSDIGSYGGEIPTPNLDALAHRGVRFTQFYATPRCSPTRSSLLTGLYPHQAGMGHLDNVVRPGSSGTNGRLSDRSVTIAEVLREAGYLTAMSGKWHLGQDNGSPPWQRGFDRALSLRAGGMYFPTQNFRGGGDALTARAREPLYLDGTPVARDAAVFGADWYATDLWTDFGLRFIDEARKASKPFFLYLPYNAPHFPLMAPAEAIAKHRGRYKAGWDALREARYRRQIAMGLIDRRWPLSPRDPASPPWESLTDDAKDRFDHLMAVYAAMIEAIDTSVGRLVKELEARGALDNTLILFLSDNGANAETGPDGRFNGDPPGGPNSNLYLGMNWATLGSTPFRRFKHFTHEGGIAVPLIAHWPRGNPRPPPARARPRAGTPHRRHADDPRGHRRDLPARVPRSRHPAAGGRQPAPALARRVLPDAAARLGARRQSRGAIRQVEARVGVSQQVGALRHDGRIASSAAIWPPAVPISFGTLGTAWDAWAVRAGVDPWTGPARLPWGDDRRRPAASVDSTRVPLCSFTNGITGSRSPNVVQYGPKMRQDGGAGQTKDQHEATRFTTPANLQNLHPRFKSGRRLQFSRTNRDSSSPAGDAGRADRAQIVPTTASVTETTMTTTATRCAIYAVLTIPLWTGACARDVTDDGVDPVPYFEMSDNMMGTVIRSSARADVGKKVTFVGLKSGQPKVVLRAGWTSPLQKMYKDEHDPHPRPGGFGFRECRCLRHQQEDRQVCPGRRGQRRGCARDSCDRVDWCLSVGCARRESLLGRESRSRSRQLE